MPEVDHSQMKLGCLYPLTWDTRFPKFGTYIDRAAAAPQLPSGWDWGAGITDWPMMGNDIHEDCVEAGLGHQVEMFTAKAKGTPLILPDSTILGAYSAITGYDPNVPGTDNGTAPWSAMDWWKSTGFTAPDGTQHKIDGYITVNLQDPLEMALAIYVFGGVGLCVLLPQTARTQDVWDVSGDPHDQNSPSYIGSWGGHYVPIFAFDSVAQRYSAPTWGIYKQMTYNFVNTYGGVVFAFVSEDFLSSSGLDPLGVDLQHLLSDLQTFPNFPSEDEVQQTPITISLKAGHGWLPSPVPSSKVVSVTIVDKDPAAAPVGYARVPMWDGDSSDGRLVFGPSGDGPAPDGNYGAIVWSIP